MQPFEPDRFGVSTNLLDNPEDIVGAVRRLSSFPVVEIELEDEARRVLDAPPAVYDTVVERLIALRQERRLSLSVHASYVGPECDLAADDPAIRRASIRRLATAVRFSADVGASRLTYHPGYVSRDPGHRPLETLFQSIDEIMPAAEASDVTLCVENMGADRPKYIVLSPAAHVDLCEKTGSRLTFDVVHHVSLCAIGPQFFDDLALMLPHISNVHLADAVPPKHVHLPLGRGTLPVGEVLTFLRRSGYSGNVIVEETGGGYTAEAFVEHAGQYRDGLIAELA